MRCFSVCSSALGACADSGPEAGKPAQGASEAAHALAIGDRGDEVRKLHDYLASHGYFPNDALSARSGQALEAATTLPAAELGP